MRLTFSMQIMVSVVVATQAGMKQLNAYTVYKTNTCYGILTYTKPRFQDVLSVVYINRTAKDGVSV